LIVELRPNTHLEPAPRGDCLTMSLTLAPRPHTRHVTPDDPSAGTLRAWLAQIASPSLKLLAFKPAIHPGSHSSGNPVEAEAVARAAGCPDLFAIHAPEQICRERVITDLVWATGSERVLVLSPDATTADRLVERLVKVNAVAVRALAEDENPARPSPLVARATSTALASARLEQLQRETAAIVAGAAARSNALDAAMAAHAQLEELARQCAANAAESLEVNNRRQQIEQQVQLEAQGKEITAFTALIEHNKAERQAAIELITRQRVAAQTACKEKEEAAANLHKQAGEGARKSGFFSRLFGRPKPTADSTALGSQFHEAERDLNEAAAKLSTIQKELEIASAKFEEEREQLIQSETAVRRTDLDHQLAQLTSDSIRLKTEIEAITRTLRPHQELADERAAAETELASARQRAAELERTAGELVKQTFSDLRIVVGTPGSLSADPVFDRDRRELHGEPQFGLLVLDRAEELTEHDFIRLAKLANRWVLVGDLSPSGETRPHLNGKSSRHAPGSGRNGRANEAPFAARLARLLDREKWAYEADRFVCRLQHLNEEEKQRVVREPLLDRPEIELRFITNVEGEPVLVEVAFPLTTNIATAKSFLYHQLGEVLLRPCGEAAWHTTPTAIAATWAAAERVSPTSETAWIDLEPGIREKIVGAGLAAFTAAVAFDPALGWDVEKAGKWLNEHLSIGSPGRFATVARR
jgi:hypothetical protein